MSMTLIKFIVVFLVIAVLVCCFIVTILVSSDFINSTPENDEAEMEEQQRYLEEWAKKRKTALNKTDK